MKKETRPSFASILIMIAACAALLTINVTIALGQQNSEYTFRQMPVWNGQGYLNNGDPAPALSMDCLAANGFGQWTLNSHANGTYGWGWYLLANYQNQPCVGIRDDGYHPNPISPGIVAQGGNSDMNFTNMQPYIATQPKATANLDGSIAYVWVEGGPNYQNGNRSYFHIQWLKPSEIDISMGNAGANRGLPMNDSRQIVNTGLHEGRPDYMKVFTGSNGIYHDVVDEADYHDDYDITSDGHYLFITWCTTTNTTHCGSEIWVMALDVATMSVQMQPTYVDCGTKPTIASNARNNRQSPFFTKFDVAYIQSNVVKVASFDGNQFGFTTLTTSFALPSPNNLLTATYALPLHARVLRSSVDPTAMAVYALVKNITVGTNNLSPNPNSTTLLFYPPNTISSPIYVDGPMIWHNQYNPGACPPCAVDKPIVAFENPYPNHSGSDFFFHCVYQEDASTSSICNDQGQPPANAVHHFPLLIVRGGAVGVSSTDQSDTRLILNWGDPGNLHTQTLLDDPSSYVAAINQMGIHVHWLVSGDPVRHYYARDINRMFGEGWDIEENTLVTGLCEIGPQVQHVRGGKRVTIWTDPNYGDDGGALYQPPLSGWNAQYVGTLRFRHGGAEGGASDNQFIIGKQGEAAFLTMMPSSLVSFETNGSQKLIIAENSRFDYYAYADRHDVSATPYPVIEGTRYPAFTDDPGDEDGFGANIVLQGTESHPANLVVHSGADFYIGEDATFTSNFGHIDINFWPDCHQCTGNGTSYAEWPSIMTFEGSADIENSSITGHWPGYTLQTFSGHRLLEQNWMIHVAGSENAGDEPGDQMTVGTQYKSLNNVYSNVTPEGGHDGLAQIRFDQPNGLSSLLDPNTHNQIQPIQFGDVIFDQDQFHSVEITASDPQNTFWATNSTFEGSQE